MRNIVEQLVASGKSLDLGSISRFYVDDSRLQRNLQRVMADPLLTAAVMSNVIIDHRVVETMTKANVLVRKVVLQLEAKLGRKLSRDRAQKILAAYDRLSTPGPDKCVVIELKKPERARLAA